MKLVLMRHCKSSWSHPQAADHDRPLNARGYRSARVLGAWLRAQGHVPDLALISSSRRTMETFEGLNLRCESRYTRALYHADAEDMLRVLNDAASAGTVLMIGHNPGIGDCAERLVEDAPDHERFFDYPTGATLVVEWDGAATWKNGRARDFMIPRALLA